MDMERPKNLDKPAIEVKHADLERYGDYMYRSVCSQCRGLLLVGRDSDTFVLQEYDRCILCGQLHRYTDIAEMRKREGLG